MKTAEEMIAVNRAQAEFYDNLSQAEDEAAGVGYPKNRSANLLTRVWSTLRYRQQEAARKAGIEELKHQLHRKWLEQKRGGDFLEIGCFFGSASTFPLIEHSGSYLGIELSAKAVAALQKKIQDAALNHKAKAIVGDFLVFQPKIKFDLVYTHGVLHHFENSEPLFSKIASILKPDGVLLFTEPSMVNPAFRLVRSLYRPFQSDASWEWPFNKRTVATMEDYLSPVEGFGWGKNSLFMSVLVGLPFLSTPLLPVYLRMVRSEAAAGWNCRVWWNSTVTGICRLKF